jgi:hypothetical protein
MNDCYLEAILIGSIILATAVSTSSAETRWNRVAPQGAGFSIEAPSEPQPDAESGKYVFESGFWFLAVQLLPVNPIIQELVEHRDRRALVKCLESMRDSIVDGAAAKRGRSSAGDLDGYPSLRFSLETGELEGTNLLVVTPEHFYLVITVGPKGSSDDTPKRFIKSFRLATTNGQPVAGARVPPVPPMNPVTAKLAGPIQGVARLIIEKRTSRLIDEVLKNAPPAAGLGDRWNPSTAAWRDARVSFSSRIARVVDAYEKSGEVVRMLETEFGQLAPESQAALAAQVSGPAGPAIVRQLVLSGFLSTMSDDDPDGPKPGEPGWKEKMRALKTTFDQRIGSAMPADDGSHDAEADAFFSAMASDATRILFGVVERATSELEGAINLMVYDNSAAIGREIETVIARVK